MGTKQTGLLAESHLVSRVSIVAEMVVLSFLDLNRVFEHEAIIYNYITNNCLSFVYRYLKQTVYNSFRNRMNYSFEQVDVGKSNFI